jgi:hypothetical protein
MLMHERRALGVLTSSLTLVLVVLLAAPSWAAEKARLHVDDYQIEAELEPHLHQIKARAKVRFTALQDLNVAVFELHNDLRVTRVYDEKSQPLALERVTQDSTVRVPLPAGLSKDSSMTLTFEYEGQLESADNSPVPGLKLAYIGDDTSYLFYAGRGSRSVDMALNRFTSNHQRDDTGTHACDWQRQDDCFRRGGFEEAERILPTKTFTFVSDSRAFRDDRRGVFQEYKSDEAAWTCTFISADASEPGALHDDSRAGVHYFITLYGLPQSQKLKRGELPGDAGAYLWAPEIAGIGWTIDHGENQLPVARRRDCTSMVGRFCESGEQGRLVAERWLLALFRGVVCGERRRGRRSRRGGKGYVGRSAGLRHSAPFERGQARHFLD